MGIPEKLLVVLIFSTLTRAENPAGYSYNKPEAGIQIQSNAAPPGYYQTPLKIDVEPQTFNLVLEHIDSAPNFLSSHTQETIPPFYNNYPSFPAFPELISSPPINFVQPSLEINPRINSAPVLNAATSPIFSLPSLIPPVDFVASSAPAQFIGDSGGALDQELVGHIENVVLREEVRSQNTYEQSESKNSYSIDSGRKGLVKVLLEAPQRSLEIMQYSLEPEPEFIEKHESFESSQQIQHVSHGDSHHNIAPQIPQPIHTPAAESQDHVIEVRPEVAVSQDPPTIVTQRAPVEHKIETVQHEVVKVPDLPPLPEIIVAKGAQPLPIPEKKQFEEYGPPH